MRDIFFLFPFSLLRAKKKLFVGCAPRDGGEQRRDCLRRRRDYLLPLASVRQGERGERVRGVASARPEADNVCW